MFSAYFSRNIIVAVSIALFCLRYMYNVHDKSIFYVAS